MTNIENAVMVADASEVDPDALALFRVSNGSTCSEADQQAGAGLASRTLAAVDLVSSAVVGEIAWRRIPGFANQPSMVVFTRLLVAEGRGFSVSQALIVAAAAELAGDPIETAVLPGSMASSKFGADLAYFGIQWLLRD